MDWNAITFDWNRARAFLVTAEEGSFSAAGRALGLSQPTVGRQVASLEEELDVTLFERVGGGLTITEAGLQLVEHVRAMGEAAARVSLAATGQQASLEGLVRITASQTIAAHWLPPVVADLRRAHPGSDPLLASNRTRRIDFALFMVHALSDDTLIRRAPAINGCQTPSARAHRPDRSLAA